MAQAVASLKGVIRLDDSDFRQGMQNSRQNMRETDGLFQSALGNMQAAGVGILGLGAAGAVAVGGFVANGIAEFASFERGMNEVFTLLPGISAEAMGFMEDDVLALSERMGILPDEIVPALYQALSAGVPPDNVFSFLETAGQAAIGGGTDLTTTVDGLTTAMNSFGVANLSASEANDIMFTGVRLGKTDYQELSNSMFQLMPVLSSLNGEFGEGVAAVAAMTSQGTPTSVAMTQMRQAMLELGDSSKGVGQTYKELTGVAFADFLAQGGSIAEAMGVIEAHAADMGIGVNQLFGSVEAGNAALQLTGEGMGVFTSNIEAMTNATGAGDTAFETMNQGISRNMDIMSGAFHAASVSLGSFFGPTVEWVTGVMATFMQIISGVLATGDPWVDWIADLPAPLRSVGVALGNAVAWFRQLIINLQNPEFIQPWVAGISEIATNIWNIIEPIVAWVQNNITLNDALVGMGILIGTVVAPAIAGFMGLIATVGLVIAGISVLRQAWENDFLGIKTAVETAFTWMLEVAFPAVSTYITETFMPNFNALVDQLTTIWTLVQPHLENLRVWFVDTAMPAIVSFITDTVIPGVQGFIDMLVNFWTDIQPGLESFKTGIETIFNWVDQNVVQPLVSTVTGLIDLFGQIVSASETAGNAASAALDAPGQALDTGAGLFNQAGQIFNLGTQQLFGGGRASGGPVDGGTPYLVGEEGPEIFTPRSSGSIMSNSQSQQALGGSTIQVGGITVIANTEAEGRAAGRAAFDEITTLARSKGLTMGA